MPLAPELATLGEESFVSLTTFRKTGVGVPTTVWVARDGDELVVTTSPDAGKVKRLRNNPRVTLVPSSRMGKVADDAVPVEAQCVVSTDPAVVATGLAALKAKYGLQWKLFMGIRGGRSDAERVILRIS